VVSGADDERAEVCEAAFPAPHSFLIEMRRRQIPEYLVDILDAVTLQTVLAADRPYLHAYSLPAKSLEEYFFPLRAGSTLTGRLPGLA
jgi:hypothetical protein